MQTCLEGMREPKMSGALACAILCMVNHAKWMARILWWQQCDVRDLSSERQQVCEYDELPSKMGFSGTRNSGIRDQSLMET